MITIYLYPNIIDVQIWDKSIFTTRNRYMYAKPVTVYRGIDNPIQIRVRNQEQIAVDMTSYSLQVDIQDPENFLTVESFGVAFQNISKGFGTFVITKDLLDQLDQRQYKLTFRIINVSDNQERPAYIDDNYTLPLDLNVLPGYYSSMPPDPEESSDFLTIDGGTI